MCQVSVPDETSYSIFIPRSVASDHNRILQLLSVTCGREDAVCSAAADSASSEYTTTASGDTEGRSGYLVLVRASRSEDGGGDCSGVWQGDEVKIDLTGDMAIAVSHMEVGLDSFCVFLLKIYLPMLDSVC